jgi:hypothetical protein
LGAEGGFAVAAQLLLGVYAAISVQQQIML